MSRYDHYGYFDGDGYLVRSKSKRDEDGEWIAGRRYVTEWMHGRNPRTKEDYPYSYDAFWLWGKKGEDGVYSDRLQQWDYQKEKAARRAAIEKHGDVRGGQPGAAFASTYLSTYFGREVKCTGMIEGCNVSNGYPYFYYYYSPVGPKKEKNDAKVSE